MRVWSAASSRGHEAYSLAMYLALHLRQTAPDVDYEIIGTDVDHDSIAIARNGVYQYKEVAAVPLPYQEGNWTRGSGEIAAYVRAREALRSRVKFEVHNILDPNLRPWPASFDLVLWVSISGRSLWLGVTAQPRSACPIPPETLRSRPGFARPPPPRGAARR